MTRDEFLSGLELITSQNEEALYRALDGAYRQVRMLHEEYEQGCLRLTRVASSANRSLRSLRERKRKNVEERLPYEQQEFRIASAQPGSASTLSLIAKRLQGIDEENKQMDRKMEHRLRQIRLEARSLIEYRIRIDQVESAYSLISLAADLRNTIVQMGYDPDHLSEADLQRIESLLTKG